MNESRISTRLRRSESQYTYKSRISISTRGKNTPLRSREAKQIEISDDSETDDDEYSSHKEFYEPETVPEYLQVTKLVRFAKNANQTGTVLALLALEDHSTSDAEMICLLRLSGVQLLVNLLRCSDQRSKLASLKLLQKMTDNKFVVNEVVKLGGVYLLLCTIENIYPNLNKTPSNQTEMQLALEVLGKLAISKRVKRLINEYNGLSLLLPFLKVDILIHSDNDRKRSSKTPNSLSMYQRRDLSYSTAKRKTTTPKSSKRRHQSTYALQTLQLAATILWRCCQKRANVIFVLENNLVDTLMNILQLQIKEIDLPIMGVINQCCVQEDFRVEALSNDLIYHAIRCAKDENSIEMQILAATTIGKCTKDDPNTRDDVRSLAGLYTIVRMIELGKREKSNQLKTALYTFWMCLRDNKENCQWLSREGYAKKIMDLIGNAQENEVAIYSFGILQEFMAASTQNSQLLLDNGITIIFTDNLQHTDHNILIATNQALKIAAEHTNLRELYHLQLMLFTV